MSVREEKEESVEQSMGPVMCDPRSLIEGLNPQQEEAVNTPAEACSSAPAQAQARPVC